MTEVGGREMRRIDKTPSFTDTFEGRLDWKARHCEFPMTSTPVFTDKKQHKAEVDQMPNTRLRAHYSRIQEPISPIVKTRNDNRSPLSKILQQATPACVITEKQINQLKSTAETRFSHPSHAASKKEKVLEKPVLNFNQLLDKYADEDEKKENRSDLPELKVHFEPVKVKTYKAVSTKAKLPQRNYVEIEKHGNGRTRGNAKRKSFIQKVTLTGKKVVNGKVKPSATKPEPVKVQKPVKTKEPKLDGNVADWILRTNQEFADIMNFDLCVEKH